MKLPDVNEWKKSLAGYFDLTSDLLPQEDAETVIREGVSFRGTNIIILIIAIFIASLGLNTNSTAVIIGAMLISPLMGPIIGIGLAVGIHDFELMKRSFRNLMAAAFFSIITSCIYFMISPVNEGHSELLARTSPTIYDVFIAFFGGAAGIIAISSKVKGNVIPGVAIATALMPPLCTVGYGLATFQMTYFFGALFLFFINSVFIACATTIGVKLMNYHVKDFSNPERAKRVRNLVYTIAILTMIPAGYLTYRMFQQSTFMTNCDRFVDQQFNFEGTQVLHTSAVMKGNNKTLTVSLIGRALPQDSLVLALTDRLPDYHLGGTRLKIIQGENSDGMFDATQATSTMLRDMYQVTQNTINSQRETIDSLRIVNENICRNDTMGATISPELKVLFPEVADIAITRAITSNVETGQLDTLNIALVHYSRTMNLAQREKFTKYLEARLSTKSIKIVPTE
ncbi:MAG: TIGR00341 family protein [Muribaculaceae bacterium]|nr:TIGR00341 family protein [Muribaculaceae bacterium]MDE5857806.1 TIGR00341 family protein [Muribaculaceae bacterium]